MSMVERQLPNNYYMKTRSMCLDPENQLSLQPIYSKWLWRSSWLHCVSIVCSWLTGAYDLTMLAAVVLFTSLNYWRKPDYGKRRYMDIICVQVALWWMALRSFSTHEPHRTNAWILGIVMIICYMVSVWLHKRTPKWCTFFHSLVHLSGNLINVVMCAGISTY
jgi:hypothetical protein